MNKSFLQDILNRISECDEGAITEKLGFHFSHTPDNLSCGEAIRISRYQNQYRHKKVCGLKTKNYPLTKIAYTLENEESDVYKAMLKGLPRLTKKEWEAFTRLITLICCDLEKEID